MSVVRGSFLMSKFFVSLFALIAIGFWSSFASATTYIYEPFGPVDANPGYNSGDNELDFEVTTEGK